MESAIVQILLGNTNAMTIDELMKIMDEREDKPIRSRIDNARAKGWNIVNVAPYTFQLKPGTWRDR